MDVNIPAKFKINVSCSCGASGHAYTWKGEGLLREEDIIRGEVVVLETYIQYVNGWKYRRGIGLQCQDCARRYGEN